MKVRKRGDFEMKHKKIVSATAKMMLAAIVMGLILGSLFGTKAEAAKKVKLSEKKLIVTVKKTKVLKLKNNKKKVKWSVTSGKKFIKLKSKKKTSVKIVGKKAGKSKVQAKIGKKKYVCRIFVKEKKKSKIPKHSEQPKPINTSKPVLPTPTRNNAETSGYIKTKNGTIIKGPFSIELALKSEYETGWYSPHPVQMNSKTGRWHAFLEPGEYVVCGFQYNGIPFTEDNTSEIVEAMTGSVVVGTSSVEHDFVFDGYCVMGQAKCASGEPLEGRFEFYPDDTHISPSYTSDEFASDADGKFCFLIPSSTGFLEAGFRYNIKYILPGENSSMVYWDDKYLSFEKIDFNGKDIPNLDLKLNYYKISGVVKNHNENISYEDYSLWEKEQFYFKFKRNEDDKYTDFGLTLSYNNIKGQLEYIAYLLPDSYIAELNYGESESVIEVGAKDRKSVDIYFDVYPVKLLLERDAGSSWVLDDERSLSLLYDDKRRPNVRISQGFSQNELSLLPSGKYEVKAYVFDGSGSGVSCGKIIGEFSVPESVGDVLLRY